MVCNKINVIKIYNYDFGYFRYDVYVLHGVYLFLFATMSSLALGITITSIQWIAGLFLQELCDRSVELFFLSPICFNGVVLNTWSLPLRPA